LALTEEFADSDAKTRQWTAFVRKGRLDVTDLTLNAIVRCLRPFLMPPTRALAQENAFESTWLPGGPWIEPEPSPDE